MKKLNTNYITTIWEWNIMFLDDLEPLEKFFYSPKNQYSRLEQILAVLE